VFIAVKVNNVIFKEVVSITSEKHSGFIFKARIGLHVEALCCVGKSAES
jgi:hypothetical protein